MKKLLVYLDQSYLSSMAKEAAGETRVAHAVTGRAMGELLKVLRALVDRDRVLCPSSTVHDQETGFDGRLEETLSRTLNALSDGIKFYPYPEIELGQTFRAMRRYLGLEAEAEDGCWEHALMRDPHRPIKRPRIYAHIAWPQVFAEDDRRRKARMQAFRQHSKRQQVRYSTFSECRRQQVLGVVSQRYKQPYAQFLAKVVAMAKGVDPFPVLSEGSGPQEALDYLDAVITPPAVRLSKEYSSLTGLQSLPDERFWEFFLSPEFDAIPYYDIFCSLEAGFLYYKPDRKPRSSDPHDMAALASVLPYVDIVTTDSAMKDMLCQLGLDKKYKVEVYSPRLPDVRALTQRLTRLA